MQSTVFSCTCKICGTEVTVEGFDDPDIILMPYPHIECPCCGNWLPMF